MTSGVPKKYHGGTLGVPQWYRSTAGWVFPLHATHCYSKTTGGAFKGTQGAQVEAGGFSIAHHSLGRQFDQFV